MDVAAPQLLGPSAATGAVVAPKPLLRGWSHTVAVVVAAVLCGIMVGVAPGAGARASLTVYMVGLTAMFGVSAMYHRLRWSPAALRHVSRLDHSTIFLAIAGTYTPIAALAVGGWAGPTLLALVWVGAVVGISLVWLPVELPRWLFTAVYAFVGWVAVIALPQILAALGVVGFGLIVGGGVCYTLGAVVYATKRPDPWPLVFGFHEIFHVFTILGAGLHLAAVGLVVLPAA